MAKYPCKKENSYSTTEQATGETWINGKPIYQKVINVTTSNPATVPEGRLTYSYTDESVNADELISVDGYFKPSSNAVNLGNVKVAYGGSGLNGSGIVQYTSCADVLTNNSILVFFSAMSSFLGLNVTVDFCITIKYTKV